ncbi:MAG: hypothetical protein KF770_10690 [Anaerolineae bacterium]|nr:hypothetical protein [Anaerolineae bacterium]
MIDAVEAVINLAKNHSGLTAVTGGRIDIRHRYGQDAGDWPLNSRALILSPVGGLDAADPTVQRAAIEARCYGDTYYDAGLVYRELRALCKQTRRAAHTGASLALVYYLVIRGNLRRMMDDEIRPNGGMPAFQVILETAVAEEPVLA